MSNTKSYRRITVLTLITVLLVIVVKGISFGQLSTSPGRIKDESTQFVVWIVTEDGTGSGVLINKNRRHVVTNDHVTGENMEVQVFFAVRDSSGDIVRARPFYGSTDHQNTLERLGYVTRGRVIAKYDYLANEPDLAIIELDGLPGSAVPRKLPLLIDYSKMEDEHVHILGHPNERPLWQSKVGLFKDKRDNDLLIYADAYFGNSGGPVLNKDGKLIGITKAINTDKLITFAVPTSAIIDLYETIEQVRIFSIYNNTELPIKYKIKWNEDENWEEEPPIEPKKERPHSLLSKDITAGYPKISYENSQNSKESSESPQKLETKSRYFGIGIKDVGNLDDHIEINDALRYQFMSDPETKKISLVKLKLVQTFMIHNNTKASLFFYYRWHEDEKWTEEYIKSNEKWRYGQPSERVSPGYPVIRFDKIQGDREYPERNRSSITLLTQTGYFDKTTKIKEDIEQIGGNPPLYYQFKNNVETNGISLEELKRTQRFKIQNPTDVGILFKYKWRENDIWSSGYIHPNDLEVYEKQHEIDPSDSAEINYSKNVNIIVTEDSRKIITNVVVSGDNKSAENIQKIETQIGYSNKNGEFIPDQYQFLPFEYHFKYNSKAKKISLHEGVQNIPQRPNGRFFSIFGRSFSIVDVLLSILIVVLGVLVAITYFPKRPIFIIHNNTKSNMIFQVKWEEDEDWDMVDPLEPDEYTIEWRVASPKEIPQGYPKVRFESIVNDKKETTEQTLKFDKRRFWHKSEPKTSSDSNEQYYFEFNPDTKTICLVDSEEDDE